MDEVWILSLCLTLFGFFIFILSLKTKQEPEPESISKSCGSSASAYASSGGKSLEVGDDEVEKMMERLNKLLSGTEATKKEIQPERKKVVLEKQEDLPHRRADMESTNETQEPVGKVPGHTQPANQPSHHRVQPSGQGPQGDSHGKVDDHTQLKKYLYTGKRRPYLRNGEELEQKKTIDAFRKTAAFKSGKKERSAHAAVENIMDEIEQAVQETEESDYYARRRQERAAARAKQWTE